MTSRRYWYFAIGVWSGSTLHSQELVFRECLMFWTNIPTAYESDTSESCAFLVVQETIITQQLVAIFEKEARQVMEPRLYGQWAINTTAKFIVIKITFIVISRWYDYKKIANILQDVRFVNQVRRKWGYFLGKTFVHPDA